MTAFKRSDIIEALVLIRDGLTMATDGINKILESTEPKEQLKTDKPTEKEFNDLRWIKKDGSNGSYEQLQNDNSNTYKKLVEYLKTHNGFSSLYGFKVFFHFKDENLIDRKR